jgi:hypothetical protein
MFKVIIMKFVLNTLSTTEGIQNGYFFSLKIHQTFKLPNSEIKLDNVSLLLLLWKIYKKMRTEIMKKILTWILAAFKQFPCEHLQQKLPTS